MIRRLPSRKLSGPPSSPGGDPDEHRRGVFRTGGPPSRTLPQRAAIDIHRDTRYAVADAVIDLTRVAFTMIDGRQTATLEVAVFCGDEGEKLAGELWQTIDLRLTAETYQRAQKEGWRTWPACRSPGSRGISK